MFAKIVIGMDSSDTAHKACDSGVELAVALGAEVHLVTAYEDSSTDGSETTPERQQAAALVEDAAAACDATGGGITTHAVRGSPAATVLKIAEEVGADLIVVGNKGATGPRRVLGSVASAVTSQAPRQR